MSIREIIAAICIVIGLFVFLCSILGIYRFKYALNRMHAAALGDTMGIRSSDFRAGYFPHGKICPYHSVFLAIQSHFDTPDCEGRASDKQRL